MTDTPALMRIKPSGNVGIGTNNPQSKLHVHHQHPAPASWQDGAITVTNSLAPTGRLALGSGTQAANTFLPMVLGNPVGNRATMVISEILPDDDNASHAWPAMSFQARVAGSPVSAIANRALFDWRNVNTRLMTMTAAGNLGIGTTDPAAKLDINGTMRAYNDSSDPNAAGNTVIGGSITSSRPDDSATRTHMAFHRKDIGSSYPDNQRFILQSTGTSGGDGGIQEMRWTYRSDVSPNTEIMSLHSDGRVGIGTTGPGYKLHVEGTAYATGAAGALSDRRHKDDIHDLGLSGLATIERLRPVSFHWKTPADPGMEGEQFGFIAQEVEEILPQVVLTHGEGDEETKGIKPTALIPVLVKAVQELKTLFEDLIERLEAFLNRVNILAQHNDHQDKIIADQSAVIATLEAANDDFRYRIEKIEASLSSKTCH